MAIQRPVKTKMSQRFDSDVQFAPPNHELFSVTVECICTVILFNVRHSTQHI